MHSVHDVEIAIKFVCFFFLGKICIFDTCQLHVRKHLNCRDARHVFTDVVGFRLDRRIKLCLNLPKIPFVFEETALHVPYPQ